MKIAKTIAPALALVLLVSTATADLTNVRIRHTPADVACAGCISHDLLIDFEGNLRGQQLFIQLDSGSIYNTPATGGETAPASAFLGFVPALAYDSFVTIGGLTAEDSEDVLVVGGAVDIPGAPSDKSLAGQVASIAWAPGTGVNITNGSDYVVARITLSGDAQGTAMYFGSTSGGGQPLLREFLIPPVPEPSTAVLACLGLLGLLMSVRR